ncbi:MAG TPA: hypothetical protein VGQ93_13225 [Lysobacter sp.]|nr:hypothetical protein [Lysobacter sp.]
MRKSMVIAGVCVAAMGAGAWAMAAGNQGAARESVKERVGELIDLGAPKSKAEQAEARFEARLRAQTTREASLDVGDPDSFGRNVKWLGYLGTTNFIELKSDCTPQPGGDPNQLCMQVDSASQNSQWSAFRDIAHITLPARSMHSFLCHWMSPTISAYVANDSGLDNRQARLNVMPTLTVESTAFNDPALVDPETGEPLNGKAEIYTSSSAIYTLLDAGERLNQRLNTSRTCVGGYISRRGLMEVYGLSERQADEFFNSPVTIRMNLQVSAQYVQAGFVSYAIRFVGD